jgi:hypothetical protein
MKIDRIDEKTISIECDMCEGTHLLKSCEGPPDPSQHFALVGEEGAPDECVLCVACKQALPLVVGFLNRRRGHEISGEELRPLTTDRIPEPPKPGVQDAEPEGTTD